VDGRAYERADEGLTQPPKRMRYIPSLFWFWFWFWTFGEEISLPRTERRKVSIITLYSSLSLSSSPYHTEL
jgi:hypothetical protein